MFYFAVLSAVTPPVAAAAMVGSKIAESDYVKTGMESLKLILPFFIVPFFLTTNPIVMGKSQPLLSGAAAMVALIVACGSITVFSQGYFLVVTKKLERIGYLLVAVLATIYGLYGFLLAFFASIVLFIILCLFQFKRKAHHSKITHTVQKEIVEPSS